MSLTENDVKNALISVLQSIQIDSGLECPVITGSTKPLEQLPEFDSKIWPVATGLLASKLGIQIPNDVNIFSKEKTCTPITVDETVALVMEISKKQVSAIVGSE